LPYYLYCLRRRALLRFFIYSTIKPRSRTVTTESDVYPLGGRLL